MLACNRIYFTNNVTIISFLFILYHHWKLFSPDLSCITFHWNWPTWLFVINLYSPPSSSLVLTKILIHIWPFLIHFVVIFLVVSPSLSFYLTHALVNSWTFITHFIIIGLASTAFSSLALTHILHYCWPQCMLLFYGQISSKPALPTGNTS